MQKPILKALVLQGGGALGAYELGVARVLYKERAGYAPDIVAGTSIGAITATLLARPRGGNPLAALETFWKQVEVSGAFFPPPLEGYASFLGNPKFFMPRSDYFRLPHWTSFYDLSPLRETLAELVDEDALARADELPRLLMTATDITAGAIKEFYSGDGGLTLDHVLASCSLPPAFPPKHIDGIAYWDGGLFDNTPLGFVIAHLDHSSEYRNALEVIVVNLFPNVVPEPVNMAQVLQLKDNLQFANKTASDFALMQKFNVFAGLLRKIRTEDQCADLRESDEFKAANQDYIEVPTPIAITRAEAVETFQGADFSREGIAFRAREGKLAARRALLDKGIELQMIGEEP